MSGSPVSRDPLSRPADDWLERVRAASDIVEIVGQTVSLRRAGRNWVGLCPFHGEKTPSFAVHPERQFYHCFSCKAGGDVFRFVQETEKVGFLEAVELLSRRAGIAIPERRSGESSGRRSLVQALELAAASYEQWLADPAAGAKTRAYLERRGLSQDTIRDFRLGLAPEGWDNLVRRLGRQLPAEMMLSAGLGVRRESGTGLYDRFRNRLMVPLVAVGGTVVGFGARALGDETPKYLNSPESPLYRKGGFLFGLEQARRAAEPAGEMILVEGYFDVMAMHQAGLRNIVASSGTALTPEQARLIKRVTERVAFAYDGDQAGREAMMRSLGVLLAEGLEVVVVELPAGGDPDSVVRDGGPTAWETLRRGAYDPVEFIQRHLLQGSSSPAARERGLQAVVRLAAEVRDPIRGRLLLERASEVFGLAESVLVQALERKRFSGPERARPAAAVRAPAPVALDVERLLLRGLLHAPAMVPETRAALSPEDFHDPPCAALAAWLWSGRPGMPEEEPAASLARELAVSGDESWDWNAEVRGAVRRLRERRLRRQLHQNNERLRRAAAGAETETLMREIVEIHRSLSELDAS